MAWTSTWQWLDEIAAEPKMLTANEIADALGAVENRLGQRPVQVVGPPLRVRWRVGNELLSAVVQYVRVVDWIARGKFFFEVSDYAEHDRTEHLALDYQGDPDICDEFQRPYLWSLRACDPADWVTDLLPSVETWAAFRLLLGEAWSQLPLHLQMLPPGWFDQPVTCEDSWHSIKLEFTPRALRARTITVVNPDGGEELSMDFTPEAALAAGPLLTETFASNFAGDFPFTDLDLNWTPARDFHGVYIPPEGRPESRARAEEERSAELTALASVVPEESPESSVGESPKRPWWRIWG